MRLPPPGGVCNPTHRMEHPWWHSCWSSRSLWRRTWLNVAPGACAVSSAPSFWNTPLWQTYAEEAGLFEVHFRQGPLGHTGDKPTTVGTNLPDLRDLQGLQGEVSQVCCSADSRVSPVWAPGFVQAIVYALQRWPCYRLMKFTQADWEQHHANNHVPYRRDCAVCIHGAGNGRRRRCIACPPTSPGPSA